MPGFGGSAVAFGSEIGGTFAAYDLVNSRRIGQLPKTKPIVPPKVISPDGRLFAGHELGSPGGTVRVWNLETGQVVQEFSVSERHRPELLEFLDRGTLLALFCSPYDRLAGIWAVGQDRPLHRIQVPFERGARLAGAVISPGDRYLVVLDTQWLHVYDLKHASCRGRLRVELLDEPNRWAAIELAFSPDGRELAAFLKSAMQCRLVCWDFESGQVTLDKPQPTVAELEGTCPGLSAYRGPALQCLPGDDGWLLYGHVALDRSTGAVTGRLAPMVREARHIRPDGKMLVAYRPPGVHKTILELAEVRVDATDEPPAAPLGEATSAGDGLVRQTDPVASPPKPLAGTPPMTATAVTDTRDHPPASRPVPSHPVPVATGSAPLVPARAAASEVLLADADESDWAAQADPPPAVPRLSRGGQTFSYPLSGSVDLIVPHHDSRYVVLREHARDLNILFDIDLGKPASQPIDGGNDHHTLCVSADGRWLVTQPAGGGTMVQVWSFETGKRVCEFDVGVAAPGAAILTPQGSLLVVDEGRPITGTLWEADTGQKLGEFVWADSRSVRRSDGYGVAVSPGGRYAAILFHRMLHVWELNTGRLVGRYNIHRRGNLDRFNCLALRFTPEGDELAALFGQGNFGVQMHRWDFSTGKLVQDRELGQEIETRAPRGPEMEWLAGHSFFLYRGTTVVEHQSGEKVYEFKPQCDRVVKLIDLERLLVVRKTQGTWSELAAIRLPRNEIVAAVKAARAAPGAAIAPASSADRAAVRLVPTEQEPPAWSLEPDSLAQASESLPDRVRLSGTVPPRALRVLPQRAKAYLLREQKNQVGTGGEFLRGTALSTELTSLHVVDLGTGEETSRCPLPRGASLLDVSRDGDFFLTRSVPDAALRLDLWSLDQQPGHAAGWLPDPTAAQQDPQLWGAIVDRGQVLTVSNSTLTSWQLPACRADFQIADFGVPLALSPQRSYLAAFHRTRGLRVYDTSSGRCRGALPLPDGIASATNPLGAVSFHPSGRWLIALLPGKIAVWDLTQGRLSADVAVMPQAAAGCSQWLDDRYIFFHSESSTRPRFLFDLQNRVIVRQYSSADACWHVPHVADSRIWYCNARRIVNVYECTLVAASLPLDEERAACEAMRLENQRVAGPGTRVALAVHNSSTFAANLETAMRRAVQQCGLVLDPSGQIRLEVTLSEKETDELVEIGLLLDRSSKQTILIKSLTLQCRLVDRGGKELWRAPDRRFSMNPQLLESGLKEQVTERLRRRVQEQLDQYLSTLALPQDFFPTGERLPVPTTNLPRGW